MPVLSRHCLPWEKDFVPALVYICLGRENMSAAYLTSGGTIWLGESELPEVWEILSSVAYRWMRKSNGCSQVLMKALGIQLFFERRMHDRNYLPCCFAVNLIFLFPLLL